MSRLGDALGAARRRLGPRGRTLLDRLLYEAIYSVPAIARLHFFSGGYHPPEPGGPEVPALAASGPQVALYDFVLRVHPGASAPAPRRVLDIGCGLGGGLLVTATALPGAALAGVDQSRQGLRQARRLLNRAGFSADLRRADAGRLPFPDAQFDLVLAVGLATYVGWSAFLAEAARVTAPGGVVSMTMGTSWTAPSWTRERLELEGRATGLALRRFTDITPRCLAALEQAAPRHAAIIGRLPGPLRSYAAEWATLPGSRRHARYLAGERTDVAAMFVKTG
ncbi:hypothetical protein DFH01_19320 [Falsiroseomonas bella]|uniref:Methyltransferase domain-containing protein n=1 Tax=Falsiroseomonas bella TaxID=2184016 RepID=A0A317FAA1_9PROT|nr:class I SAM-dependent methyltransferase [Falsiroseomonas bella]PWS35735.1 hypothetical protein DFH01_19320 [Falsiroseomonas bella]